MFMHDGFAGGHSVWMLILAALVVVPFWRISARAGYPGWSSLLVLVPFLNVAYLYFLAFAEWPSQPDSKDQA